MGSAYNNWSVHKKLQYIIVPFLLICMMLSGCAQNNTDLHNASEQDMIQNSGKSNEPQKTDEKKQLTKLTKNGILLESGVDLPLKDSRVIDLSLESDHMGRKMPFKVYLPKGYGDGKEKPVWYGLHGSSSNESMWLSDVGVGEISDKMIEDGEIEPMIMVFPLVRDATLKEIQKDLEDDGKVDERNIDRYICTELVPYIDSVFETVTSADGRYIGGFSMGGMISLRVAFHHPDMFSKVGGYSAAVISSDYSERQLEEWLFPYEASKITDIESFSKAKGLDMLRVYLDCGTSNDPFLPGLQSLYEALQKRGIPSEFLSYKGGHDLAHAREAVKEYLMFYAGKH